MRYEHNLATGEVTEHEDAPATPEVPKTYQQLRAIEYAKRNQFEMLGDDKKNGTNLHGEWVAEIKAAIPKPPIAT